MYSPYFINHYISVLSQNLMNTPNECIGLQTKFSGNAKSNIKSSKAMLSWCKSFSS